MPAPPAQPGTDLMPDGGGPAALTAGRATGQAPTGQAVRRGALLYVGATATTLLLAHLDASHRIPGLLPALLGYVAAGRALTRFAAAHLRCRSPLRTRRARPGEQLRVAVFWPVAIPARLIEAHLAHLIYAPPAAPAQAGSGTPRMPTSTTAGPERLR